MGKIRCEFYKLYKITQKDRELYYEVSKAEESIQKIIPDKTVYDDLIQFQNDPRCRLSNVKKSIVRRNLK